MFTRKATSALCLVILMVVASPVFGQRTRVATGFNLFTQQQDVELGQTLAQANEPKMNLSADQWAYGYINALGNDVAKVAPGYKYPYVFRIFNDPSIRSFALPGGRIYVSSGLVEAAQNEAQLAAVLAHQIGHVVARHGTERVSTAYSNSTGSRRGTVPVADAIRRLDLTAEAGSILVRHSRQEEQEADTIAVQMLYDARFDPRILTTEFQRLTNHPNSREFFQDHPAPANRAAAVRRELQRLGPLAANLRADSPDLQTAQRNLRNEPTQQAGQVNGSRPDPPSTRFVTYQGYDFEIRHPENWYVNETGNTTVTLSPEGGNISGTIAYGMVIDTFQPRGRDIFGQNSFALPGQQQQQRSTTLSNATDELIADLRRSNPNLRVIRSVQKQLGVNTSLEVELQNDSPLGGREVNRLTTVLYNDTLYYFLGVAPQADFNRYNSTFDRMIQSVRFY